MKRLASVLLTIMLVFLSSAAVAEAKGVSFGDFYVRYLHIAERTNTPFHSPVFEDNKVWLSSHIVVVDEEMMVSELWGLAVDNNSEQLRDIVILSLALYTPDEELTSERVLATTDGLSRGLKGEKVTFGDYVLENVTNISNVSLYVFKLQQN